LLCIFIEEFYLMVRLIQFVEWSQVLLDSYITLSIERVTLVSMASNSNQ